MCDLLTTLEMLPFSDASLRDYGACGDVKSSYVNETVSLLCAKSMVSRLKPMTVSRLELCAALITARLSESVVNSDRYKFNYVIH